MTLRQTRQELRKQLLNTRKNLELSVQRAAAVQIAARICALSVFNNSQNIACYLAIKGEVDVHLIMQQIWAQGKNCYLPALDPQRARNLNFIAYKQNDALKIDKYGLLEPQYTATKTIDPKELDLVITPLVGFDPLGDRLGQGGGYYDCTFSFKLAHPEFAKPCLIGVAYEWQKLPHIDTNDWDVKLDAIATEERLYVASVIS